MLVNNAGGAVPRTQTTLDADLDLPAFADVLDVNVLGPLRVVRAFLPHLRRAKAAKVMALSSQLGGMTYPGSSRMAYRASKAALNKIMQGVSADLAGEGLSDVIAHPGWSRNYMRGPDSDIEHENTGTG